MSQLQPSEGQVVCRQCGNPIPGKPPKRNPNGQLVAGVIRTCEKCQKINKKKSIQRRRAKLRGMSDGMNSSVKSTEAVAVGFQKIADMLGLTPSTVHEGYRSALFKLRKNGGEQLRQLLQREGIDGLLKVLKASRVESQPAVNQFLDYQIKILELWQYHNRLVSAKLSNDALKVRKLIERFQSALQKEIKQFLNRAPIS